MVQFCIRMQGAVMQSGIITVVCNPYGVLYQSLLCRRCLLTWQHYKMVVVAHVLKSLVLFRLMPVIADYSRFEIVRSQYGRYTAQMLQAHPYCLQEALRLLRRYTYHIGIVAVRHESDKHLHLENFSSFGIHITEFVTGKVDHEFLARFVDVGQYGSNILLRNEILLKMVIEL